MPQLELADTEVAVEPPAVTWLQSAGVVYGVGLGMQALLFGYFWQVLDGNVFEMASSWGLAVALLTVLPLHEALHGVLHARMGLSSDTVIGISRQVMAPFCIYRRPTSRQRAIATALSPFLGLTVLPAVLAWWAACPAGLAVLAVLNMAGCGLDLSFAYYAWRYLSRGSTVGYDRGNLRIVLTTGAPI